MKYIFESWLPESEYEMFFSPRYYRVFNVQYLKGVELELPQVMTQKNEARRFIWFILC